MLPYIAAATLAGMLIPIQALINARLGMHIGGPITAALVNFLTGTLFLIVLLLAVRLPLPTPGSLSGVSPLLLLGGVMGAFFVAMGAFVVPKLGAAGMVAVVIASQLIASLILDHFGVLQGTQEITWARFAGACFLLAGAFLILRPAS